MRVFGIRGHGFPWPRSRTHDEGVADVDSWLTKLAASVLLPPLGWLAAALDRGGRQ